MPDVYINRPLNKKHQITILNYVVELDDVYSVDQEHIDHRHIRTDEFIDMDIYTARKKACIWFQKESKRLKSELEINGIDDSRHLGLMLYFTYKKKQPVEADGGADAERFYIMDGESLSTLDLLRRLQIEYYHLLSAGVEFDSIEVEMGGERYFVPLGRLFEIGGR